MPTGLDLTNPKVTRLPASATGLARKSWLAGGLLLHLAVWLIVALYSGSLRGNAATKPADHQSPIPRDLFLESKPVPNEDNAIFLWRRAAQVMVKADDKISEQIAYAAKPEAPPPDEEAGARVQHWLKDNREALELMESSLKKPAAQWLARQTEEEQPELWSLYQLARARLVIADDLANRGKYAEAFTVLEGNLRLAQTALEAEAALIHYLIGARVRTVTERAMLRLANHRHTPPEILRKLLAALPPLNSETNTFVRTLRVEFTVYGHPTMDVKWFAEAWAKPEARTLVSLTYPEEFQRPFMVLTDPGLVALHLKPFNQLAASDRLIATYRRYRTNVLSSWTNRIERDEAALEKVQSDLLEEIEPLLDLVANESLPLSQDAIAKARRPYLAITDPVGRILQCQTSLLAVDDTKVFRNRTEREAVRAVLAAILFERQKEQLPRSLEELPEEKLLSPAPWDYFAAAPLRYSKEQRLIWSVGEDAEDDGGDGEPEAPWSGLDAVWKIPNRIK